MCQKIWNIRIEDYLTADDEVVVLADVSREDTLSEITDERRTMMKRKMLVKIQIYRILY